MATTRQTGRRVLPAVAVVVVAADAVLFVWLLARQDGTGPAMTWFLGGMAVAALLAIYGAIPAAPFRGAALASAGTVLLVLGVLGLASIGAPLLVAGVLCWIAAAGAGVDLPGGITGSVS